MRRIFLGIKKGPHAEEAAPAAVSKHVRWRSRMISVAIGVASVTGAVILLDRAFPPDLARLRQPSVLVSDKDCRLLQAFTARDGAWRLPVTVDEVDGRYISMLFAYED